MRYPSFLPEGGRIGFIAPSFGCTTEPYRSCFEKSLRLFRSMGYETVTGPNCFRDDGIGKSSTPENCAAEINEFFLQDRCDVIISCGGGETMCEDLPLVDFEAISHAPPKWYMGYSDNTNLTFTLPILCDTAAIYGPCASAFAMKPLHRSLTDAMDLLAGKAREFTSYEGWEMTSTRSEETPFEPYNITEPTIMRVIDGQKQETTFAGRLIGGCLDCLTTLVGTRFDRVKDFAGKYREDGLIWFLESCDLTPMGMRRALWQMENAGWFEHVRGFLIGRPLHFQEEVLGMDRINAVTGILSKYKVPVVLDVDLGHLPPMMPLISGALAEVSARPEKLAVKMKLE